MLICSIADNKGAAAVTIQLKEPIMLDGIAHADIKLDAHTVARIANSAIGMNYFLSTIILYPKE